MDAVLETLGGCGRFQFILGTIMFLSSIPSIMSVQVMAFAMYDPGWICLDNTTAVNGTANSLTSNVNGSLNNSNITRFFFNNNYTSNDQEDEYCRGFDTCENIQYNSDMSTIVTEWGLSCDKAWILNTILSVQMAGSLCATLVMGYVGDRFGRKNIFVASKFFLAIADLMTIYSISWKMFAANLFFTGFCFTFDWLAILITLEYSTAHWRVRVNSMPSWFLATITLALSAMATEDWKTLKLISCVSGAILFILILWIPNSLRWLTVKGKEKEAVAIATKIAKINKVKHGDKSLADGNRIQSLIRKNIIKEPQKSSYTIIDLFKHGYFLKTIIVGWLCLYVDILYFAFSFGVAALPGNIYTNMILFSVCDLPVYFISFFGTNRFRRKPSMVLSFLMVSACLFGVVALDLQTTGELRTFGVLGFVLMAKLFSYVTWIVLYTTLMELYPTVVRCNVNSFGVLLSSTGGVIAPYVIPTNPETFYICYLFLAVMSVVCAFAVSLLPETKGKPLKDTFEKDMKVLELNDSFDNDAKDRKDRLLLKDKFDKDTKDVSLKDVLSSEKNDLEK